MKRFPWIFTALWLAVLSVMLWAGFWQLERAAQKESINERLADEQFQIPQTLKQWQQLVAFNRIRTTGEYLDTHLILDNQIMDGQVGHFIFTVFKTINNQIILVNRGWTDNDKQPLDVITDTQEITALVADWPRPGIQLGEQSVQQQAQQNLTYMPVEKINQLITARHCPLPSGGACAILPQVLKLDPGMAHGFERNWQLPRMTVAKHQGYAAQWFTMSLVLCFVYGLFLKKTYFNTSNEE